MVSSRQTCKSIWRTQFNFALGLPSGHAQRRDSERAPCRKAEHPFTTGVCPSGRFVTSQSPPARPSRLPMARFKPITWAQETANAKARSNPSAERPTHKKWASVRRRWARDSAQEDAMNLTSELAPKQISSHDIFYTALADYSQRWSHL